MLLSGNGTEDGKKGAVFVTDPHANRRATAVRYYEHDPPTNETGRFSLLIVPVVMLREALASVMQTTPVMFWASGKYLYSLVGK